MKLPWVSVRHRYPIENHEIILVLEVGGIRIPRLRGGHLNIGKKAQEVAQERIAGTDVKKTHGRRIAHRQIGSIVRGKIVVDFQTRGQDLPPELP